jgi:hypothetical protein
MGNSHKRKNQAKLLKRVHQFEALKDKGNGAFHKPGSLKK